MPTAKNPSSTDAKPVKTISKPLRRKVKRPYKKLDADKLENHITQFTSRLSLACEKLEVAKYRQEEAQKKVDYYTGKLNGYKQESQLRDDDEEEDE
jgi:hypothetical protein